MTNNPLRAVPASVGSLDHAQLSVAERHRDAVVVCSRVLLSAESLEEIDDALRALLAATDATSIFVEVNVDDPELGPCSSLLREITEAGLIADTGA